jgi:hypothetical protein
MAPTDYDDPAGEASWVAAMREGVIAYLKREGVAHGGVWERPDLFVAPYVSIWRVVSRKNPRATGWWAIAGDLPTDYLSSADAHDAREAMKTIAARWRAAAESMKRGVQPSGLSIGTPDNWMELGPLLAARADLLARWADDDALWSKQ